MWTISCSLLPFLFTLIRSQPFGGGFSPYQAAQPSFSPYALTQGQTPVASGRASISVPPSSDCNYDPSVGPYCKRSKLSPFMCKYNDNYPRDVANYIDDNYGPAYKGLSVTEIDVWDVYDGPIGESKDSICESEIELVRPGYIKNVKDQWRAVVQTAETSQTIRVERCLRPGSTCRHVPGCYETTCKQRYSYIRLLVFDPCKKVSGPSYEMFRIPTACDCHMTPPGKKSGGSEGFGVPDFIVNNPEIANQMKNIEPGAFNNLPSTGGAGLSGKK